jgi:short-subunit dehydrogenase
MSDDRLAGIVAGASTGVGRQLAVQLAERGASVILVSRDAEDLRATADDIRVRFGTVCLEVAQDLGAEDWDVEEFVRGCTRDLGEIDFVLIPAGGSASEDIGANPALVFQMAAINYLGPARLAAAFGQRMGARGKGTILFFSSIAAVAPRSRNAAYSASKAALEVYARSLRHALEPSGVRVGVVALGYVDTALSFGQRLLFPRVSPESVARYVLKDGIGWAGRRYVPRFWSLVTLVLRCLPWSIYRRLSF